MAPPFKARIVRLPRFGDCVIARGAVNSKVTLHVSFLISTPLRMLSWQFFIYVHKPEEVAVGQMVRILRSVRGLNMATGFNYLLHPFIEVGRERPES